MNLQHETITYHIQEALDYLKKVLKKAKDKTLDDGEFLPEIEHILWHINFAFNARYLDSKKASSLKQLKYGKYLLPPKEIFGKSFKKKSKTKKN